MVYYREKFDTELEADQFIDQTYKAYHPMGYGTRLRKKQVDGKWIVEGSRGTTAD